MKVENLQNVKSVKSQQKTKAQYKQTTCVTILLYRCCKIHPSFVIFFSLFKFIILPLTILTLKNLTFLMKNSIKD